MRHIIIYIVGSVLDVLFRIFCRYKFERTRSSFHSFGKNSLITYPFIIQGEKNIYIDDHVSIRAYATLSAINAKICIKKGTAVAPYLYISTGNHRMIPGRFFISIADSEKGQGYDGDVVVNEDVWIASRVTILKGVTIGRGSIIAAGAVVSRDVMPYSVVGGVPARFIKFKWTLNQVLEHEKKLYPVAERFSREELISFGMS